MPVSCGSFNLDYCFNPRLDQLRCMKTVVEIPEFQLESVQRITGARSPEEAIAKAVSMFLGERENRRALADRLYGSIPDFMSQEELQRLRKES